MLMARLKAALFDCTVLRANENDASALGAAMIAMAGKGEFPSLKDAADAVVFYETVAESDEQLRKLLLKRYAIYKEIYVKLKGTFKNYSSVRYEK